MTRQLEILGTGYDERRGHIFLSIDMIGLSNPNTHTIVDRELALDLIRGLAAALQKDDLVRERARAERTRTAPGSGQTLTPGPHPTPGKR